MDKGHWEFPHDFDIDEWFGFIYRITELSTGKEYIGKKQFHSYCRKAVKGKKRKKMVITENTGRSIQVPLRISMRLWLSWVKQRSNLRLNHFIQLEVLLFTQRSGIK